MPEVQRSERPPRLDIEVQQALDEVLQMSPRSLGLKRNGWEGVVVAEYLERVHGVHQQVREAQRGFGD